MTIQDTASNALAVPDGVGQMIGYEEPEPGQEVLHLDMYNFLINPIRAADARVGQNGGNLFVKRYLAGPQAIWDVIQRKIFATRDLWDVTRIADEFLIFLKNIVGWTAEPALKAITDRLTDAQLRKLIATSVLLWKQRGKEEAYEQFLSVITDARMRVWNWFDLRWILDETVIGEEHQGRDPWLIDTAGEQDSDIRIVDDGGEDRILLLAMLALFRPGGERLNVYWVTFMDRFLTALDNTQWSSSTTSPIDVADQVMALSDDTQLELAQVSVTDATEWARYVASWRLRGDGVCFGGLFYYQDDDNYYALEVCTVNGEDLGLLWRPTLETLLDDISGITGLASGTTYDVPGEYRDFAGGTDDIQWALVNDRTDEPVSFNAWINPDIIGGSDIFFSIDGTSSSDAYQFRFNGATGSIEFLHVYDVGTHARRTTAAATIVTGAWQHVAVTYVGNSVGADIRIYVDGVEATYSTTTDGSGTRRVPDGNWYLGNTSLGTQGYDGQMRYPEAHDRILTPAEVANIYNASGSTLLRLVKRTAGVELELGRYETPLVPDVFYGLRVHVESIAVDDYVTNLVFHPRLDTLFDAVSAQDASVIVGTTELPFLQREFGGLEYIQWPNVSDLAGLPLSISIWMRWDVGGTPLFLNPNAFISVFPETGFVQLVFLHATTNMIRLFDASAALAVGGLHQLVMTYDGAGLAAGCRLWVDGVEVTAIVADQDSVGAALTLNGTWDLGAAGSDWAGVLFDFRIYDAVLTPTQAVQVAQAVMGSPDIRTYWEGEEIISGVDPFDSLRQGSIGARHLDRSTLDLSEAEMYQLPLERDLIDLNDHL